MKDKINKTYMKKFLSILFYVLMFIFLVKYFQETDFSVLKNINLGWGFLAISFLIRMIGLMISPFSWEALLKKYHGNILPMHKMYMIYAESWMGRYIPGKIGWIGGKILFATNEGVSTNTAVITSFLDSILQVFSSMLVAAISFVLSDGLPGIEKNIVRLVYFVTAGILICLIPPVFNRIISAIYRIFKRKKYISEYWMDMRTIIKSTTIVSVAKMFSSIAVGIIAIAVIPQLSFDLFLYITAANLTATAIGMVALFAPAGLGVKESIQIVMLSAIIPKEIALIIVTIASLQSILGDIVFFLGTRFLKLIEIKRR